MKKNTYLILLSLIFIGCYKKHNTQNSQDIREEISPIDTCQKIKLTDSLYLGFISNMTKEEYNKHIDNLIAENKINAKDTSVTIYLPNNLDEPKEFKLYVRSFFNGCYLNTIRLVGSTLEENSPVYNIDNLMIKKYGKGIESGYSEYIVDNGRIINGLYGTEYALIQLKKGEAIIAFRKKNNDKTWGRRLWNINGVQIEVTYEKNDAEIIEIDYQSINYLNQEKSKKKNKEKQRDSINDIKINSSTKSF